MVVSLEATSTTATTASSLQASSSSRWQQWYLQSFGRSNGGNNNNNNRRSTKFRNVTVVGMMILFFVASNYFSSHQVYNHNSNSNYWINRSSQYPDVPVATITTTTTKMQASRSSSNGDSAKNRHTTTMNEREEYYQSFNDGLPVGVLSNEDIHFFRQIQSDMDHPSRHESRCRRYGGYYNRTHPKNRRIFYGALAASEPWEVFEIVAAETYGLFSGIVFVEGNRTQNFTPRKLQRIHHLATFQTLFNVTAVQVRTFVNEDSALQELTREHVQRSEIILGWKELGMQPEDVGYLADTDETFTRDFLKAVQVCDGIEILDYEKHHCHHSLVKLTASTRVFETSPHCITADRHWFHPDMIIGHCIEGITDKSHIHPPAPRGPGKYEFLRQNGYGGNCGDYELEDQRVNNTYSLWNAADFRRACGGYMVSIKDKHRSYSWMNDASNDDNSKQHEEPKNVKLDVHTGYHFHNFFSQFKSIRFKYSTYGHADQRANTKPIHEMSNDLNMMYQCIKDNTPASNQFWKHIMGGYDAVQPFYPIYFQDSDYRRRRHQFVQQMVQEDEDDLAMLLSNNTNR